MAVKNGLFKSVLHKVPGTATYNLCKVGLIYDLGVLSCANGSHSRTKWKDYPQPERENAQDLPTENATSINKTPHTPWLEMHLLPEAGPQLVAASLCSDQDFEET